MYAQERNSCLLNMPVLVLERILTNIPNPSNVSCTCEYLYEIVCGMEKSRRLMCIRAFYTTSHLNIDDDAVFDSIMNSHRTINEIELQLSNAHSSYELNERQLEQITAILKQFGANVTSLKFHGVVLPISIILDLLRQTPKLESLLFIDGNVEGSVTANTTMPLQLPNLKALKILRFPGLSDIVDLITVGSLNSFSSSIGSIAQSTILTKQHNIKSLTLEIYSNCDLTNFCLDHLQLDTLIFRSRCVFEYKESQLIDILKCQTNLKELRFISYFSRLSGSFFQWICVNLKNLEIFEVQRLKPTEGNDFKMLGELKQLRHFRIEVVEDGGLLFDNEFPFKSDSIEKFEIGSGPEFSCDEVLNSIALNLPNLTHLNMEFKNFSALSLVLRHCSKIIHLNIYISNPIPHQLTQQRFPNIQTLVLRHSGTKYEMTSQCMTSIVHTMPNLKSMSLFAGDGLKYDVKTMREFIKGSKSLEYLHVNRFELHRESSADDVVETIRCLVGQLKRYHINFSRCTPVGDLNLHEIKDILSNDLYVRKRNWNRYLSGFYLYKGEVK